MLDHVFREEKVIDEDKFEDRIMSYTSAGREGIIPRRSLVQSEEKSLIISNICLML